MLVAIRRWARISAPDTYGHLPTGREDQLFWRRQHEQYETAAAPTSTEA